MRRSTLSPASDRPTVAHIVTIAPSFKYLMLNQLRELEVSGYAVSGISSPGAEVACLEEAGIPHHAVPITRRLTPLRDLVSLWRLYRLIRREQFVIVHTHNPKPGLLGQLAAWMAGTPLIVNTIHGFYFTNHTHPVARRLFVWLERLAAGCSDLIWSQNREDMEMAIREGICSPKKIRWLGNGIDIGRFDRARLTPETIHQTRTALGLPDDCPVVGFVGRLVTEKGVHELMQAARIVRQAVPNVHFLIVGATDSEKRDAITPDIARQYGLAESCLFTGQRQDMPELYAQMDLFVLPSHREGLPRSPMEACAMQVPCVVTDVRGCREVITHEQNGLIVPLHDVPALATAILRLLRDRDLATRLGQTGRRIAEIQFNEQDVFARVKTEYARLLDKRAVIPDNAQLAAVRKQT